jgi:hypothetical protein
MVTYTHIMRIQRLSVVKWTTALDARVEMFNKWGVLCRQRRTAPR